MQNLKEHGRDQRDRYRNAKQEHDDPDCPDFHRGVVALEFTLLGLVRLRVFFAAHFNHLSFLYDFEPGVPAFVLYHFHAG